MFGAVVMTNLRWREHGAFGRNETKKAKSKVVYGKLGRVGRIQIT